MTDLGPLAVTVADGVAIATFDRPPVNAFDVATYSAINDLVDFAMSSDAIRVLVLTAPETARCWCGGADLRDFVDIDLAGRKERYEHINATVPRFASMGKPVVAAITGHAIGIGVLLAAACDLRIASEQAYFSTPEIDYGLIAGSSQFLNHLGVPESLVHEMACTGRRVPAARMLTAGFLNEVVARQDVLPAAMEVAAAIASKSLPVVTARKQVFVEQGQLGWLDAYKLAQRYSGDLVELRDAREGVQAFLEARSASVNNR